MAGTRELERGIESPKRSQEDRKAKEPDRVIVPQKQKMAISGALVILIGGTGGGETQLSLLPIDADKSLPMASFLALHRTRIPSLAGRVAARPLSTTRIQRNADGDGKPSFPFANSPAPPRLPEEEQKIFEELQRRSTGAFSTPQVNQSPQQGEVKVNDSGEELHPDAPVGVKPEFEGDKNPKTGEVGGPKNEPLRWGSSGDWSYSGRVTDF